MRIWTKIREEEPNALAANGKERILESRVGRKWRKASSQVFGQHGNQVVVESVPRIDHVN